MKQKSATPVREAIDGSGWAAAGHPEPHPSTYHRTHGIRYFHGCYSISDDNLWGVNCRKKEGTNTLAALRSMADGPCVGTAQPAMPWTCLLRVKLPPLGRPIPRGGPPGEGAGASDTSPTVGG